LADICGLSTVFGFVLTVCFGGLFAGFLFFICLYGYPVIAVEPFSQVYQFASVAAERVKLCNPAVLPGRIIDNLITYRTSAFHNARQSNIHTPFYKGFPSLKFALDIFEYM
jgi:hypothetical protein